MNKSNQMKGKGHHNKVQTPANPKNDSRKKEEDPSFVYNLGILIGCVAEIETIQGEKFEGVLSAFTQQNLKIMIEAAHEPTDDDESSITKHYDLLIVPAEKIAVMRFRNAEVSYATRDFQTDAVISAGKISVGDKELTPWVGADDDLPDGLELESNQNGWEVQDMFRKNEEKYGVRTTFKEDLSGYTTQIDKTDSESLKKQEEQAAQVAKEIEGSGASWDRTKVENGDDEEEAFSAVVRPSRNSGTHANNNAPQNNITGGSDKYVPPSRRQSQQQQQPPSNSPVSQNHPLNNNGPPTVNNNNQSNNRKSSYGGGSGGNNQNPRSNYGPGSNNSYHERRNNYDRPRGPPQNQYSHAGSHGDGRRLDDGRQPRMGNKGPGERDRRGGRDNDQAKLQHFQENFRIQEPNQPRMRPTHKAHSGPGASPHSTPPSSTQGNVGPSPSGMGLRNSSPPSNNPHQISSSSQSPTKPKKDEYSPVPPLIQPSGPASTNSENSSNSGTDSPRSMNTTASTNSTNPSPNVSSSAMATSMPADIAVSTTAVSVPSSESQSSTAAAAGSPGDSKSVETDSKTKKFTFNPNAKEFNPTMKPFQPRSPSTPPTPRPPSTPASTPQQLMPAQMQHPSIIPYATVPQQPIIYATGPPHFATHAQATLTPSSNSSASSGGNTPRQRNHKGIMSVQTRQDVAPQMQMAAGPPLSIQPSGPPPPFAYVQGGYSQIVRLPGSHVLSMYPTDNSGGTHMPPSMHFIHHNGGAPQTNAGHQSANQPQNNPLAPAQNVPSNGHAYGQGAGSHGHPNMSYPIVTVPAMLYPQPGHQQLLMPYLSHQGGNNPGIPHSQ